MELEKLILSEDEVLEFVDTKAREQITNTNTTLNKKVDDYTKAVSSDFTNLRSETDNTVRYLTSIITNHQDVTDEELGRIREELLNSIPKNLSDLVDDKGFLTHLPEELITEIELALALDDKGFIKLEDVVDKINILRQELKNYSDEKTQQHITDTDTKLTTLSEVLTQYINTKNSDLTSYVDNLVASSVKEIIPEDLIDAKIEAAAEGHASTNYVDSKVREATADKATITYVDNRVQSYVEDKVTLAEVNAKVNNAVADKATTSYVDTAISNAIWDKATETFTINYVDNKISKLIGTAPETLDTLSEIADAIKVNDTIINTLNSAIGLKADKSELTSLTSIINSKANKTDLDSLREELSSGVSDAVIEEINSALALKADKKDIPTTVASLADAGNYVTFNNIAISNGDYGLVKLGSGGTGIQLNKNGVLQSVAATDSEIETESESSYRNLQPRHVSKIVKQGLINNTLTWSETEKAAARTLLDLNNVLNKITDKTGLYLQNQDGTVAIKQMASGEAKPWTVAERSTNGTLYVGDPTENKHSANKAYVDNNFIAKQTPEFDAGATRGYVYFIDPNQNQIVKKVQIQANADTIPLRNPSGTFYVGNATLPYEAVNKGYVDTAIANIKPFTVEELEDGSYSITLMEV